MAIVEVEPYANQVQRFYFEELEWCGCGNPDEVLAFMRDVLQVMHDRSEGNRSEGPNVPFEQSAWRSGTDKLNAMLPGMLGLSYLYMLDALDLTEHGSTIGGSWLTEKGKEVLALLSDRDLEAAMSDENHVLLGEPIPR
jgi:hypothetical protein